MLLTSVPFTADEVVDIIRPLNWWDKLMLMGRPMQYASDAHYMTEYKTGRNGQVYILYRGTWSANRERIVSVMTRP